MGARGVRRLTAVAVVCAFALMGVLGAASVSAQLALGSVTLARHT